MELEPTSIDYFENIPGDTSYPSPFNAYSPGLTDWTVETRVPGTTRFGQNCSYWYAPMNHSLGQYEKIIVKMKTTDVLGIDPYVGTSDTLDAAKQTELVNHLYWGRMVLGADSDPWDMINDGYDSGTKVITLVGPLVFPTEPIPGSPGTISSGVPALQYDVRMISTITCWVNGTHDIAGPADTLTITGFNASGKRPVNFAGQYCWNGTVEVVVTDPAADINNTGLNITSLNIPRGGGTLSVPLQWGSASTSWKVTVWDLSFSIDNMADGDEVPAWIGIIGTIIPEFQTMLIPIIGMFAMIFVARRMTRKKD